ncbi:Fe/S biogenesis protein NfuA [Buchnera aphidicola (Thelaxes suberi)]|uniref:NifU family protein n=1 Tax=Buchnera aphidicola TaxID=9 RepID=UPI0034648696
MIKISSEAKKYFSKLLINKTKDTNFRIFIMYPGTMYAECGIAYCLLEEIDKEKDIILNYKDFICVLKKTDQPYLQDATIDVSKNSILEYKLILNAPFAKKKIKPKRFSDLEKRICEYLNSYINPELSMHNGKIDLVEVTDDYYILVAFSGGCNGCSMISMTLKEGIEKKILTLFPQIKGVKDITKHRYGSHSYA